MIKKATVLVLFLSVLCISFTFAGGSSESSSLSGQTVSILVHKDPYFDGIQKVIPDFEKQTGIKVNLEGVPYTGLRTKEMTDFVGGTAQYDVDAVIAGFVASFANGKYLEPLDSYISKDQAQLDMSDFSKGTLQVDQWKGVQYAIPIGAYVDFILYRNDLFQQNNLQPPKTWDDYLNVAKTLTANDMYGTAVNAKRGQPIVDMFFTFFVDFGAQWFKQFPDQPWDLHPVLNSDAGVKALTFYKQLVQYSPPGVLNYDWFDTGSAFWTGKVGMILDWDAYAAFSNDPSQSKIVGKVAYAPPPGTGYGSLGGPSLAINAASKHKQAAWELIKYLTSAKVETAMVQQSGYSSPSRLSVFDNPDLVKLNPWFPAQKPALANVVPWYQPNIPELPEMSEILGLRLNQCLIGELSAKDALDKANSEIEALLVKNGYLQ